MKTSKYSLIHSHILLLMDGLDGKQRTERMDGMDGTDGWTGWKTGGCDVVKTSRK